MKAYWLPQHWPLGVLGRDLTVGELHDQGIEIRSIMPTAEGHQAVAEFAQSHGYVASDEVALDEDDVQPGALDIFSQEHRHTTDEVRWVLEGSGIFDVRGLNDQWIRIRVTAGDLLVLPARRWHLFILDRKIKVKRLFGQHESWNAEYRHSNTLPL